MSVKKTKAAPGPATSVSRRPSSLALRASRREPSSVSPLATSSSKKVGSLSIPVFSLTGASAGELALPKEVFGAEINKDLLAQALRVYLNNQKSHFANTKTRGEVEGSTRKIFKQKGTGKARHGGIRAPIFVGGGIALGPKYRKIVLDLPKKMKKLALVSALSQKAKDKEISGLSGIEKMTGKTKEIALLLKKLNKKSALIIVDKRLDNASRATKNLKQVNLLSVSDLNAYQVIKAHNIFLTKEAVESLIKSKKEVLDESVGLSK
ncbi:50S ribosomal protein L4 [Candidatus Daviesbacteria bacterium]|nr:50S ribosomal protein L4 [Candidatus Daviesbacteria bacterium]